MKKAIQIALIILLIPVFGYSQITKVLFIGNSYTAVNNLPQLTYSVALSTGDTLVIDNHTPGGQRLLDHAVNPQAIAKIFSNNWNYVVLQAQSQEPSWPIQQVQAEVFKPAKTLCDTIRANNSCTRPVFYMTWGRKNGDASNCVNWPPVCTYEGMDSLLNERYQTMGADNDAFVSPVGAVWHYIRDNYPQIELYAVDGSHPSMEGSYAAACTFYTIFLGKDPSQIQFDGSLNPGIAEDIREVVKKVVYDHLLLWNVGKFNPVADFSFVSNNVSTVNFTNLSSNADSYLWLFGDGNSSILENPQHTYSNSGLAYYVELQAENCGMVISKTDTVSFVLGIDENIDKPQVIIYPNPACNTLYVKLEYYTNYDGLRFELFDILGNRVLAQPISQIETTIILSGLSSGVYSYRLGDQWGSVVVE